VPYFKPAPQIATEKLGYAGVMSDDNALEDPTYLVSIMAALRKEPT
jgi:hypothetical protein